MGSEQRNALIAIVLSGLILFGWQTYFAPQKSAEHAPVGPEMVKTDQPAQPSGAITPSNGAQAAPIEPVITEEDFNLQGPGVSVTFDNSLTVKNLENSQTAFNFKNTVDSAQPMRVEFDFGNGFKTLRFARTETPNKYFNSENDATVMTSISEKGVVNFSVTSPRAFKYKFVFKTEAKKLENTQERYFSYFTDELEHLSPGEDATGDLPIKWAGIDFNYHLFANFFDKPENLLFKSSPDSTFSLYTNKTSHQVGYNVVFVKKEYNYLTSLGHNLNNSVDFGIWGFFAVWILKGLQFFYKFIPNYGVSIVLLTLLVRLITFPLQYKSFVSMKKLQLIQPELTKIREKHKEDPQRMQKESMELFRKSGANPIGGCLPLLLQMPVFFAFSMAISMARRPAGWPRPPAPSTSTDTGVSFTIFGSARRSSLLPRRRSS
jgi:YidC/Oxa1 family membrane protein insertase